VRLLLICVGKVRQPFVDDVAHYQRLLARQARLEVVEVPEGAGEAGAILKRIPGEAYVCALDREGDLLTSEEVAAFLEERRMGRTDLCFVLGGPFGLDPAILERSQRSLSFGPITLPHQLARVVLLEQLFRAHKILAGEPYHY
jgi:23S rRNA (pseudouridine1915-N3)-methyltransferase